MIINNLTREQKIQLLSDLQAGKLTKQEYLNQIRENELPKILLVKKGIIDDMFTGNAKYNGLTPDECENRFPYTKFVFIGAKDDFKLPDK